MNFTNFINNIDNTTVNTDINYPDHKLMIHVDQTSDPKYYNIDCLRTDTGETVVTVAHISKYNRWRFRTFKEFAAYIIESDRARLMKTFFDFSKCPIESRNDPNVDPDMLDDINEENIQRNQHIIEDVNSYLAQQDSSNDNNNDIDVNDDPFNKIHLSIKHPDENTTQITLNSNNLDVDDLINLAKQFLK